MNRKTPIIMSILLGFASVPSFAQYSHNRAMLIQEKLRESCSKQPNLNLKYEAADMPISSHISYRDLLSKGGQKHGVQLYGLYTNELSLQTNYKVNEFTIENNSCFYISDIVFTVKVTPNIYIANEAAQFPCMKRKVFEHEMEHHKFFMLALNAEHDNLQREIKERFANIPVKYHAADIPQITEFVKSNVSTMQSNFVNQINNRKAPYDKNLDNPNNTAREQQACQNELLHLHQLYRR